MDCEKIGAARSLKTILLLSFPEHNLFAFNFTGTTQKKTNIIERLEASRKERCDSLYCHLRLTFAIIKSVI